jgi:hypothetical protein
MSIPLRQIDITDIIGASQERRAGRDVFDASPLAAFEPPIMRTFAAATERPALECLGCRTARTTLACGPSFETAACTVLQKPPNFGEPVKTSYKPRGSRSSRLGPKRPKPS